MHLQPGWEIVVSWSTENGQSLPRPMGGKTPTRSVSHLGLSPRCALLTALSLQHPHSLPRLFYPARRLTWAVHFLESSMHLSQWSPWGSAANKWPTRSAALDFLSRRRNTDKSWARSGIRRYSRGGRRMEWFQ